MDVSLDSGGSKHSCTLVSPILTTERTLANLGTSHPPPNLGERLNVFTYVHTYLQTRVYIENPPVFVWPIAVYKGLQKYWFYSNVQKGGVFSASFHGHLSLPI